MGCACRREGICNKDRKVGKAGSIAESVATTRTGNSSHTSHTEHHGSAQHAGWVVDALPGARQAWPRCGLVQALGCEADRLLRCGCVGHGRGSRAGAPRSQVAQPGSLAPGRLESG